MSTAPQYRRVVLDWQVDAAYSFLNEQFDHVELANTGLLAASSGPMLFSEDDLCCEQRITPLKRQGLVYRIYSCQSRACAEKSNCLCDESNFISGIPPPAQMIHYEHSVLDETLYLGINTAGLKAIGTSIYQRPL